jgi:hypothetical protein
MKLDFMPFSPIAYPPDLKLLLRNPRHLLIAGGIVLALLAVWLLFGPRKGSFSARLGGLTWKRSQFCRGWLITSKARIGMERREVMRKTPWLLSDHFAE